jgi:HSP20 family protein
LRPDPFCQSLGDDSRRAFPQHCPDAEEERIMVDRDYLRDENPHQGASHSFGKNLGTTTERERAIAQGREDAGTNVDRSSATTAVRGGTSGYGPFTLMRRLSDDMDRLFENLGFGRAFGTERDLWNGNAIETDSSWWPQVEAFRRGDKFVVRADLPGIKKEDVHATIEDGMLAIWGQRAAEREENRDDFYRSERSYGSFYRTIPLPDGVESDNCEATFKDGVLEFTLPAPKESPRNARQIPIR